MGLFLTFEGGDGSGKATQTKETYDWLTSEGYDVTLESFPRYGNPVVKPVENFLNGKYGQIHPELASVLYSLDRYHASDDIRTVLARKSGIMLADRFTNSNFGHNGSKFDATEERLQFFEEQRAFEYDVLGVPRPDHNVILMVPPEVAQANIDKKAARIYSEKKRYSHEADATHQERTYSTYQLLAQTYPDEFTLIDAIEQDGVSMRSIESVQAEVRAAFAPLLKGIIVKQEP